MKIEKRPGESIDSALKRFKRECEKEGIIQNMKKHEFYKPPSVLKKERLAEVKRKHKLRALKRKLR